MKYILTLYFLTWRGDRLCQNRHQITLVGFELIQQLDSYPSCSFHRLQKNTEVFFLLYLCTGKRGWFLPVLLPRRMEEEYMVEGTAAKLPLHGICHLQPCFPCCHCLQLTWSSQGFHSNPYFQFGLSLSTSPFHPHRCRNLLFDCMWENLSVLLPKITNRIRLSRCDSEIKLRHQLCKEKSRTISALLYDINEAISWLLWQALVLGL